MQVAGGWPKMNFALTLNLFRRGKFKFEFVHNRFLPGSPKNGLSIFAGADGDELLVAVCLLPFPLRCAVCKRSF